MYSFSRQERNPIKCNNMHAAVLPSLFFLSVCTHDDCLSYAYQSFTYTNRGSGGLALSFSRRQLSHSCFFSPEMQEVFELRQENSKGE